MRVMLERAKAASKKIESENLKLHRRN